MMIIDARLLRLKPLPRSVQYRAVGIDSLRPRLTVVVMLTTASRGCVANQWSTEGGSEGASRRSAPCKQECMRMRGVLTDFKSVGTADPLLAPMIRPAVPIL